MTAHKELAEAYLRNHEGGNRNLDDLWAFVEVNEIVRDDPEAGWQITTILLEMAASDEVLAYVAAGPLEDLLKKHGPIVIDRIQSLARANQRFQLALSGVWLKPHDKVWYRWFALMEKFGFASGRRSAL